MADTTRLEMIMSSFFRVNNQLNRIQTKKIKLKDSIILTTSAIHVIDVIGKQPNITASKIAQHLNVTKGAISQQLPKLETSGYITKHQKPTNKKERLYTLTPLGLTVYKEHELLHEKLYTELASDLEKFSDEDIQTLLKMLTSISENIDTYQNLLTLGDERHDD